MTARPLATRGVDALARNLDATAIDAARFEKPQQFAVAAADVQHARAGRHHVGDQQKIDAHIAVVAVAGGTADGCGAYLRSVWSSISGRSASPRAAPAEPRKPRTMANSSGSSSRKASWPLSVTISANDTRAAPALSACTMARDSEVGNSQSDVNDTTQKTRARAAERIGQHAVIVGGEIEIIHRAGQIEIAVGIEALDERRALIAQIALHLEIRIERERRVVTILETCGRICDATRRQKDT